MHFERRYCRRKWYVIVAGKTKKDWPPVGPKKLTPMKSYAMRGHTGVRIVITIIIRIICRIIMEGYPFFIFSYRVIMSRAVVNMHAHRWCVIYINHINNWWRAIDLSFLVKNKVNSVVVVVDFSRVTCRRTCWCVRIGTNGAPIGPIWPRYDERLHHSLRLHIWYVPRNNNIL